MTAQYSFGFFLKWEFLLVCSFYHHFLAYLGIEVMEGDDISVAQADAAFAVTARNRSGVVCAAVDADA